MSLRAIAVDRRALKVAGVDHISLGPDFDLVGSLPIGLEEVSKYLALFVEQARRGCSQRDLGRIAKRNMLEVTRVVEAYAHAHGNDPSNDAPTTY